ncbi:MAG: hypothetical protein L3J22_00870 [Xanthomonadales bacterium]|nr:hypothetical protein [Xanthomonadales bacterium]
MAKPLITIAVPSFNQGQYPLNAALESKPAGEVCALDGGSTDGSLDTIKEWEIKLVGGRSHPDDRQSAAIN